MYYDHTNVKLARKMRQEMTPWEAKLWFQFLRKYHIRFQRQKPIGHYIVDFYCSKANLVVELDGGGHYDLHSEKNDKIRTNELEKNGLMVLRFCNLDVDRNFYGVCTVIDETVRARIGEETSLVEGGGTAKAVTEGVRWEHRRRREE